MTYVITGMAFFFIWRNFSVSILPPGVKAFTDQRPYRRQSSSFVGSGSGRRRTRTCSTLVRSWYVSPFASRCPALQHQLTTPRADHSSRQEIPDRRRPPQSPPQSQHPVSDLGSSHWSSCRRPARTRQEAQRDGERTRRGLDEVLQGSESPAEQTADEADRGVDGNGRQQGRRE